MQFDTLWRDSDKPGIDKTIKNSTVNIAGSFLTVGDGTLEYKGQNKSHRGWRRVSDLIWGCGTIKVNPQVREEAEWRRACIQKESFMQMLGMVSEAQGNEREW